MNDLATLNNRPEPLTAPDGETRPQADLTLNHIGDLQRWCLTLLPDPFEIARQQLASGRFSLEQEQFILRTAMNAAAERMPPSKDSDEFKAAVGSPAGIREAICLSLMAADPKLTREQAVAFVAKLDEAGIAQAASRIVFLETFGGPSSPKAAGPASPASRPA